MEGQSTETRQEVSAKGKVSSASGKKAIAEALDSMKLPSAAAPSGKSKTKEDDPEKMKKKEESWFHSNRFCTRMQRESASRRQK